jgi:hypothetical protein
MKKILIIISSITLSSMAIVNEGSSAVYVKNIAKVHSLFENIDSSLKAGQNLKDVVNLEIQGLDKSQINDTILDLLANAHLVHFTIKHVIRDVPVVYLKETYAASNRGVTVNNEPEVALKLAIIDSFHEFPNYNIGLVQAGRINFTKFSKFLMKVAGKLANTSNPEMITLKSKAQTRYKAE